MCTVTYLPLSNDRGFILTSNRDERINRPTLAPAKYLIDGNELIFPKDVEKEGTWICLNSTWVVCLLNGAFEKHKHQPPYRKSRGLVLLDFYRYKNPKNFASNYNLSGVEPFTLLMINAEETDVFFELRWDGIQCHFTTLDGSIPHIRSSATLYSPEVVNLREQWFNVWLSNHRTYTQEAILEFHHFSESGERSHDLLMQKNDFLKTVSITSIALANERLSMYYEDLLLEKIDTSSLIV